MSASSERTNSDRSTTVRYSLQARIAKEALFYVALFYVGFTAYVYVPTAPG